MVVLVMRVIMSRSLERKCQAFLSMNEQNPFYLVEKSSFKNPKRISLNTIKHYKQDYYQINFCYEIQTTW